MRFGLLNSIRTRLIMSHALVGVLSVLLAASVFQFHAVQVARRTRDQGAFRRFEPRSPRPPAIGGPPNMLDRPPGPPPPRGFGARGMTRALRESLPAGLAFAAALCIFVGWWVGRRLARPLAELAEGARALHATHFTHRVPIRGDDEFTEVALAMNEMGERVGAQIAALEEDAVRRRQILADVAHELRSPVAALKAMTAAMRDGVAETPERRGEALARMSDAAARMERLVSDLLEVSRLDLHEVPLMLSEVDLRELAEDCVYTHTADAATAGIQLAPVAPGRPVQATADRLRLAQALDNLVENAVSYAGSGAEIHLQVEDNPSRLIVRDTGVGISEDHLPFVFDAFYRADAARTPGGTHTGLGLRIARGLVEAHGGSLTLESRPGEGVRAVITLPPAQGVSRPGSRRETSETRE